MQSFLPTLTVALGIAALVLALPQVVRLYRLKNSASFSLITWLTWLIYQSTAVTYSLSIHSAVFVVINSCWTLLYLMMVIMIIRYRRATPSGRRGRR